MLSIYEVDMLCIYVFHIINVSNVRGILETLKQISS